MINVPQDIPVTVSYRTLLCRQACDTIEEIDLLPHLALQLWDHCVATLCAAAFPYLEGVPPGQFCTAFVATAYVTCAQLDDTIDVDSGSGKDISFSR